MMGVMRALGEANCCLRVAVFAVSKGRGGGVYLSLSCPYCRYQHESGGASTHRCYSSLSHRYRSSLSIVAVAVAVIRAQGVCGVGKGGRGPKGVASAGVQRE